jgi:hypothetical protein
MGLRRIVSVLSGPMGVQVQDEDGSIKAGQLVVDEQGVVRFDGPAETAEAPKGSRAEGEEVGTPEADPTG